MVQHTTRRALAALALLVASSLGIAQTTYDPMTGMPRTASPTSPTGAPTTTTTTATPTTASTATTTTGTAVAPASTTGSLTAQPGVAQPVGVPPTTQYLLPFPPTPVLGGKPIMFGSQMFSGRFGAVTFNGFNPNYQVAIGDQVLTRLWGAVAYEAVQTVDAQGNIFIPNVGPVKVLGVRNGDLNQAVETSVKRVYRANVGVYATLAAAQPVKVYVTGFVRAPGLYGGLSSDSVLYYLDKAGGIDPDRGSYLAVDVLRGGKMRARIDLYKFLMQGEIDTLQLQDGDTIVVPARRNTVVVSGEALNPYQFELPQSQIKATELMALASPKPNATHLSIVREIGPERRSEYHPLASAGDVVIQAGDLVTLMADKFPATILVRVDGAQQGERTLVMPYGSRLKDVIPRLNPAPHANMDALQLFRLSVAARQKETLEITLNGLQTAALTGRSATSEEAALRKTESEMILQFIDRARGIVPKGQVVLTGKAAAGETLMEDGDVVRIPERSNLVAVSGEVQFPNSLVFNPNSNTDAYVSLVGGYTQRADRDKVMLLRPDGSLISGDDNKPQPGDEILVMPKVETKYIEVARGITSILYQMAVAAGVLTGL
ncbi:MAG TPA: polysaccharide biosynthesis/export family protein [Ideonella sp.]|nr:polysaccharide biosynthesis/export family protein [Ideonella sp.]